MIYICVLNYNNLNDTVECIDSLFRLKYKNYKILLIDNASTDGSSEKLEEYSKKNMNMISYFSMSENRGYAAGNNVGLRYALSRKDMEYCWVLNNDTTVEPDALNWLVDYMNSHGEIGLCGSKLIYSWDKTRIQGYGGIYKSWLGLPLTIKEKSKINRIEYVSGAAVFIRREFLENVGLMCEEYFLYYEEIDWAIRSRGKYKLSCEPRSIVYHKEGASIGGSSIKKEMSSELSDYYMMRNRLMITRKYYPCCIPTVYLSSLIMIFRRLYRRQYRRCWLFIKLLFGAYDKRLETHV